MKEAFALFWNLQYFVKMYIQALFGEDGLPAPLSYKRECSSIFTSPRKTAPVWCLPELVIAGDMSEVRTPGSHSFWISCCTRVPTGLYLWRSRNPIAKGLLPGSVYEMLSSPLSWCMCLVPTLVAAVMALLRGLLPPALRAPLSARD